MVNWLAWIIKLQIQVLELHLEQERDRIFLVEKIKLFWGTPLREKMEVH